MKLQQDHRQLLAQYRTQKSMGPNALLHPSKLPIRLVAEINSTSVVWRMIHPGQASPCQYQTTAGYDESLSCIAEQIQRAKLKPGSGVVLNLWPPSIKISAMMVGAGQRAASAFLLDEIVQANPESLQLDPLQTYRVLDNGSKKVDLIGISNQGFEKIEEALPSGVRLARLLAPLSALDRLLPKIAGKIPDPTLVCLMETHRLHYFGVHKGGIAGIRVAARGTLRDAHDLRNTLNSLQIDPPSVLFVSLTGEKEDAEEICRSESDKNDIEISMSDQVSLMEEYPDLEAPPIPIPLPLSLSLTNGGKSGKFTEFSFKTTQESQVIPLTSKEMLTIQLSHLTSVASYLLAFGALALSLGFLLWQRQTPAWKVDEQKVQSLRQEWQSSLEEKRQYANTLNQMESIPRVDRVLAQLCAPTSSGFVLENLQGNTLFSPSGKSLIGLQIEGTGTSACSDLSLIKAFIADLQEKLSHEFPGQAAASELKNTTLDQLSSLTRFNFVITIHSDNP